MTRYINHGSYLQFGNFLQNDEVTFDVNVKSEGLQTCQKTKDSLSLVIKAFEPLTHQINPILC